MPGYYSVLFTRKGSGIDSIDDLAGKTFAFTDPASTSGYLIPATDIMDAAGFDSKDQLDTFFGQLTFAGSHPAAVIAVANGTIDAGATFDDNLVLQFREGYQICGVTSEENVDNPFHYAMSEDEIMAIYDDCPDGNIAVFHQSPLIPQTPFAVKADAPQSFKDAVKAALLDIARNQELVDQLERFYVDPLTIDTSLTTIDSLYDGLRNTAEKLDLDLSAR
jgi:phosphate/phosphite/phosphonate ABC transporter binding protein